MEPSTWKRWTVLALFAFVTVGCHKEAPPPYPVWAETPVPYTPQKGSSNAFDAYAFASLETEELAKKYLNRVSFGPSEPNVLVELLQQPISEVTTATDRNCQFVFKAQTPFELPPYQRGWRLIGRCFVWQIENACHQKDFDKAVIKANVATKFGFDLTGGDVTDASLGLTIVDEARQAIAPYLDQMSPSQLRKLSAGIKSALLTRPAFTQTIQNEKLNMLQAVQMVQDAYTTGQYKIFEEKLGNDIRNATKYLDNMKDDDTKERPAYFEKFVAEAETEVQWLTERASMPTKQRSGEQPELEGFRPWRRFARHFFRAGRPYLRTLDETIARTHIFILECELTRSQKISRFTPKDLSAFTPSIAADPYTGKPLIYRSEGSEYRLYSVGEDFRDDGGETDETFSKPDLRLERPPK